MLPIRPSGRELAEAAAPLSVDVVICATGDHHLLDRLDIAPHYYTHQATDGEPPGLGFACHAALRDRLGGYDYYCYMGDYLEQLSATPQEGGA